MLLSRLRTELGPWENLYRSERSATLAPSRHGMGCMTRVHTVSVGGCGRRRLVGRDTVSFPLALWRHTGLRQKKKFVASLNFPSILQPTEPTKCLRCEPDGQGGQEKQQLQGRAKKSCMLEFPSTLLPPDLLAWLAHAQPVSSHRTPHHKRSRNFFCTTLYSHRPPMRYVEEDNIEATKVRGQ